jgi:hypothetical protein
MLPSCVNPEEIPEVVYSPGVKDEGYLRKLLEETKEVFGSLARDLASALTTTTSTNELLKPSATPWWQTLGGIVGTLILILVALWGIVRYVIHAELADQGSPTNVSLGQIRDSVNALHDRDLGGLQKDLAHF